MGCAVWGLPQAGILANKLMKKCLAPHGYHECKQTPGLWKHTTRSISFTLVVDNFGVKYTCKEDINHLIKAIKEKYELTEDWDGDLYCSIHLTSEVEPKTIFMGHEISSFHAPVVSSFIVLFKN